MTTQTELIKKVRAYAVENYNAGWDVIVEAFDDAELGELIAGAEDYPAALAKAADGIGIWREREAEQAESRPTDTTMDQVEEVARLARRLGRPEAGLISQRIIGDDRHVHVAVLASPEQADRLIAAFREAVEARKWTVEVSAGGRDATDLIEPHGDTLKETTDAAKALLARVIDGAEISDGSAIIYKRLKGGEPTRDRAIYAYAEAGEIKFQIGA